MTLPSFSTSLIVAACRGLVRLVSFAVTSDRRAEWRAEWEGELFELWHRADRTPGRYPHPRLQFVHFSFGAVAHALAELRQEWKLELLAYELRHTVRFLVRNRVFSLTAALLIALGVGANTTVFTLVNAVMLRAPRGIEAPDRIAQIGRGGTDARDFDSWSYPLFADFRARNTVFSDLAAYETRDVTLGRDDDVEPATAQLVSANYFRVLGARLARGRGFLDEEEREGAPAVVVISDLTWRTRLGTDPSVIGKTLAIRGREFQIVGVAAPDFTGADVGSGRPDIWVPLGATAIVSPGGMEHLNSRFVSWLWIAGRLKPGVDARAAQAAMRPLFRQMQLAAGGEVRDDLLVVPGLGLRPAERAIANVVSAALLAIVGAVLLVACANLAALLLARGAARESEIGVRLALGASRRRVVRQLIMETALIAVVGSIAAFAFTRWTARFVEWLMPYPIAVSIQPDVRVLAFAIVVGLCTSAVFGLLPAMRTARVDLLSLMRASGGAVGATIDRGRVRSALLVGQIALSFVLLGATGLLMRTVRHASSADPGFRTDVLVGDVDLRTGLTSSQGALVERLEQVAARAASVPGVTGVALASDVPATGTMSNRTMWRADGDAGNPRMPTVSVLVVDTGYFHVMDVRIVRGRQFDAMRDPAGPMTSIVVNEAMAQRLWPGEDPIGKELALGSISGERRVPVVGVARNTRNRSLRAEPGPQAYFLLSQNPTGRALLHVRVGAKQQPGSALATSLRPLMVGSPAPRFVSVRERLSRGLADIRLIGILGATFGALALALAAAGIYGVVSYETSRRGREYGLRLALGASPGEINRMVLRQTARLGSLGIVIGILGMAGVAPLLDRWVFGVSRFDPVTFVSVAAVLCLTTALAALGPAMRASRSDPMASLRAE